ncbi:hypothetical protein FGIG_03938 [Fasciola gigantica]|uniref:DUF4590 domain-containing protein n=1 Tax=Fasciola gigantica TaxID=46835 RepID=A0A504YI74_FASGI|nr:hypothetical protein FGIG_03938 [Fasciola gigantica]
MRRHLIKTGLVTEDGEIRPESEYREIRNREDQKRALLEIIAHAIVERSLEAERIRQGNIRKTLEDICKLELHRVKRIREERQKRAEENILMQLIPRDHMQPENLQPISRSPHEGDSMKDRALVVAVSDIDEPELAMMDKRSQVEVVKAQRIRRQRKSRERNAGQPPYLYLWEPGINRRNPGSGHRLKDDERGRSKIRGDERSEPGPFLRSQQSGSREGRFSRSGPNGKDDTNTKLEKLKRKKASGFGDRLVYDDPQSPCIVRFMYLGASKNDELQLKKSSGREDSRLPQAFRTRILDGDTKAARFITVIQQPSGGNTVTVFKGYLQPGDEFEFTSRRTYGYPFSLSLCIDGTQDARVSTCCEYRHRRGARIGGQAGHFVYLAVEGSIPCFKCQAARSLHHERQKQSKKKQTKHKEVDNEEGEVVNNRVSSFSFSESNANEQVDPTDSVSAPQVKVPDNAENESGKADSFAADFQPVCTNLSRRIVKSTMWECFTPNNAELQMNLAHTDEALTGDSVSKSLQYGMEQKTERPPSQPIAVPVDQSTVLDEPDHHPIHSVEPDHSNECTAEQEYEMAYELQDEEHYSEDTGQSTDDSGDGNKDEENEEEEDEEDERETDTNAERRAEEENEEEELSDDQGSEGINEFEVLDHVIAQRGSGSRTHTESKQSLRDIVVEKVDTMYQHRMSSVCRMHMVDSGQVAEVHAQHACGHFGEILEEKITGDRVEKMTNFEICCTDNAEEAPVQEYSIVETRGTERSCASGDQQNVDVMWLSGYTQTHHQTSTPKDVDSRIPLIVVDSEDTDERFMPTDPKGEWHASFDQTQCSVVMTVSSKQSSLAKLDGLADESELASAWLTSIPMSPRSVSRTTASRSVTFTSSMSQCKTPIKRPSLSPDDNCLQMTDWNEINAEIRKAESKASALATETTEFFSVHASPQFVHDKPYNRQSHEGNVTSGQYSIEGCFDGEVLETVKNLHKTGVYLEPSETVVQSAGGFACIMEEVKQSDDEFYHEVHTLDSGPIFRSQTVSRPGSPELQHLATDDLVKTNTEFDAESVGFILTDEPPTLNRCPEDFTVEDFEESPENHVESSEESECEHELQCTEQTKDMNDSGMIIFQSVHSSSCSSANKEDIEIPETVQSVSRPLTAKSASICTTKSGKLASFVRSTIRPLVVLHASLAGRVKCVIWMQLQLKTEALFAKYEGEIDEQKQDDISMHCQGTVYQHGSPNIQFLLPKTHLSNRYEIRWPLNDLEITDELNRMEIRNLARVLPIPMQNVESIKLWLEIPHKDIYYLFEEYSFDAVQSTCVFQKPLKKPLHSDYSSSNNSPSSCGTPREPVTMSRPQSQQSFCTETHSNKSSLSLVLASLEPNLDEPQIESLRPQQPALGRQDSDSTFVSTVSLELDSVLKMDDSSKTNQRGLCSKSSNEKINIEEASFNKMKHPTSQISDGIASSDSTLEGKLAHSKSASDVNKNGESSSARGHANRNSGYDCNPSGGPSFAEQPRAESTTGISKHPKFSM